MYFEVASALIVITVLAVNGLNLQNHKCYVLDKINKPHEFGWVVPVFGLLYLKTNAARTFTKLNWNVFTGSLRATLWI